MGLDSETVARFRSAALLHDAGKFGTIAAGLNKKIDEMSESELKEYCQHPARGEEMFCKIDELKEVALLIRSHHESYNGQGFPDRLKGEDIPLGARLIAIADLIEKAARSTETHRADYALMTARFHSGTLLDPSLISKFQGIVKIVYFEGKKLGLTSEIEVSPQDLIAGMQIARDVVSETGVLLMQRGMVLDNSGVAHIRRHYRKNSPHGILIQVTEE